MSGEHIARIKSEAVLLLSDQDTDQVILVGAKNMQVHIAISIAPGTREIWGRVLREIADQIETDETDPSLFEARKNLS